MSKSKIRSFIVPEKIIPEHVVTSCSECVYFENRGGSYGEYDACRHIDYGGYDSDIHYEGNEIPDECPLINQTGD